MSRYTCTLCGKLVKAWRPSAAQAWTTPDRLFRHDRLPGLRCLGSGRAVPLRPHDQDGCGVHENHALPCRCCATPAEEWTGCDCASAS